MLWGCPCAGWGCLLGTRGEELGKSLVRISMGLFLMVLVRSVPNQIYSLEFGRRPDLEIVRDHLVFGPRGSIPGPVGGVSPTKQEDRVGPPRPVSPGVSGPCRERPFVCAIIAALGGHRLLCTSWSVQFVGWLGLVGWLVYSGPGHTGDLGTRSGHEMASFGQTPSHPEPVAPASAA